MRYMDEDLDVDMGHPRLDATTVLVVKCFATHGLRLDVDAVRRWSRLDEDVARAWIDGEGAEPEPSVIAAARSEYARAEVPSLRLHPTSTAATAAACSRATSARGAASNRDPHRRACLPASGT